MPEARRSRTGSRTPRSSGSTAGATEFGKRNANGLGQKINLARRRALVPTQGVCSRHQEQRLESLPSVSFPEVEFLMVVHPRETELYQYLQRALGDVRGVKVIMERRKVDRRREPRPFAGDRRSAPRRI